MPAIRLLAAILVAFAMAFDRLPATAEPAAIPDDTSEMRISDSRHAAPIAPGQSPYLPDGRTLSGDTGLPIPCRCRAHDLSYHVDEVVCLATPRGPLKARCARVDNVTSWIIGDETCAIAGTRRIQSASFP